MKFHLPSFLLGYGAGAATVLAGNRLRPFALEVATAVYRVVDAIGASVATRREDIEDLLAEARERARRVARRPANQPTHPGVVGHA